MEAYLDRATLNDRAYLAPLRAAYWQGSLTPAQFQARNDRLYAHPFGQDRMRTLLLRMPSGEIQSSLDLLEINLMIKGEGGRVEISPGILIASVLTPEKFRGQGAASRLMGEVVQLQGRPWSILYSDIKPEFYERFRFKSHPVWEVQGEVVKGETPLKLRPLSLSDFLKHIERERERTLLSEGHVSVGVKPEEGFWDWQLERYRFFSELAGVKWELNPFWEYVDKDGPHPFAVAPDYIHKRLDGLWVSPHSSNAKAIMSQLAMECGLTKFRFWSRHVKEGKQEYPMVRAPLASAVPGSFDVQFGEWW